MPNNILIIPGSASIQFSGSANNDTIRLQVEPSGSVAFYGNSGSLFSITDQLSGSLMSVNDISGLPILEVFSDNKVVMGSFNQNTLVVTGSRVGIGLASPTAPLQVQGVVSASAFSGSLVGIASNATSASFATTASAATSITFTPATASFAISASWAPSTGVTSIATGDGLTGGPITSTGTIALNTSSVHFLDGVKTELNTENVVSSSTQVNYTQLQNIPSGIVSSSAQVTVLLPTGTVSSSTQVNYTQLQNIPNGIVSSSTQVNYAQLQNIPSGIVSSSTQINTGSFSGSFTGNFNGSLFGTSSWATNASTLNLTSSAVFATTGSNVFVGNQRITGSLILSSSALVELQVIGNTELTGSLRLASGGITGSLFGTSSWASNAVSASFTTTASFAVSASWAPGGPGGGITSLTAGDGLTGGTITSTGTITVDTGSVHFLDGVKKELNTEGVISSSAQVSYTQLQNIPADIVSSSAQVKVLLPVGTVSSSAQINTGSFTGSFTGNINASSLNVNVSADFDGNVFLNTVVNTNNPNRILVVDNSTNQIYTTASVGGGGSGTGNGFPYDGTVTPAVISGSLLISSSINSPLTVSGSVDNFFELEVVNFSAGNNASTDVVVSSNNTTEFGNYAAFGINSTTYNAGLVGGASDGYIYLTSSVGELDIGHAGTGANANVRLFAGGPNSTATTRVFISSSGNVGIGVSSSLTNKLTVHGNVSASGYTGSFTGPLTNIPEITASGTVGIELNLNTANYFSVSASGTGTVTWTVINPPPTGRAQTFIIEYTNGGIKTNNWFTNTRWPAGVAPSLTSASANPDLLGFTTDDAGSNWRGVLLQRGSA
jgi:hypothetical protein